LNHLKSTRNIISSKTAFKFSQISSHFHLIEALIVMVSMDKPIDDKTPKLNYQFDRFLMPETLCIANLSRSLKFIVLLPILLLLF